MCPPELAVMQRAAPPVQHHHAALLVVVDLRPPHHRIVTLPHCHANPYVRENAALVEPAATFRVHDHAPLLAIVNLALAKARVAAFAHLHAGQGVGEDAALFELPAPSFHDITPPAAPWWIPHRRTIGSPPSLTSTPDKPFPKMSHSSKSAALLAEAVA